MANAIPQRSRTLVEARDRFLCLRCGTRGSDWHHRRTRAHRDLHTHCPCVGVYLCQTCHDWVHAHPLEAKTDGWIVRRWEDPQSVPILAYYGKWIQPDCDGGFVFTNEPRDNEDDPTEVRGIKP